MQEARGLDTMEKSFLLSPLLNLGGQGVEAGEEHFRKAHSLFRIFSCNNGLALGMMCGVNSCHPNFLRPVRKALSDNENAPDKTVFAAAMAATLLLRHRQWQIAAAGACERTDYEH